MKNIVSIIPVHEYNDKVKEMLSAAMESVTGDKSVELHICISCSKDVKKEIEKDFEFPLMFCTNAKTTTFQCLVNSAVKFLQKNGYKWFSVLEFDDTYNPYWFGEVKRYFSVNPEVSVFLPLTQLLRQNKNGGMDFIGYGNEAPWASAFSNEIGFIDFEVLSNYFDFYLTGSVFNTDDFLSVGGLKESMKLVFWYEFLLRLTNKEKKVYVVPKLGYNHLVDRENSLFQYYKDSIDKEEAQWWYDTAKQECYFTQDRNKTYDKNKEKEEEE